MVFDGRAPELSPEVLAEIYHGGPGGGEED
jgi:hypothetical protein